MIYCLGCGRTTSLVAKVSKANAAEGICWWCEHLGWKLVEPPLAARPKPWLVIEITKEAAA